MKWHSLSLWKKSSLQHITTTTEHKNVQYCIISCYDLNYNNNCQTCSTGLFLDPQNGIKFGNLEKDELKLKHKHEEHKIAFSAVTMQNFLCCDPQYV